MKKSKKKIFLIEDEHDIHEMYKMRLELEHFEVRGIYDGDECIEKIKKYKPDLILLDLIIPKKDGYTVLGLIKQDEDIKNIPVVIISNLNQKNEIQKGMNMGAHEFLVKSKMTPSQLAEKVKQYF